MAKSTKAAQTSDKQQEEVLPALYETTPEAMAAGGGWDMLQQGIGNRAVGRLLSAQREAAAEGVTPIDPVLQQRIDLARSEGVPLGPGLRTGLESALGNKLPDVNLHTGPEAAAMARGLNARAFTQGHDIFFGQGVDPNSEAGRSTVAHEVTHVAESRAVEGMVQREPNSSSQPFIGPPAPPPASFQPKPGEGPNATFGPPAPTYTVTLTNGTFDNLTKAQAIAMVLGNVLVLDRMRELYSGEHILIYQKRQSDLFCMIGGIFTDLFGKDMPDILDWLPVTWGLAQVRSKLGEGDLDGAVSQLTEVRKKYETVSGEWNTYKAQLETAGTLAQVGIPIIAVLSVVAIMASLPALPAVGAGAAAGEGTVGAATAVGGTTAVMGEAPTIAAAGGGAAAAGGTTAVMGGAPTIAAAGGGAAAGGTTAVMGGAPTIAAAGGGAAAGGTTAVMGGAPTIAAAGGGAVAAAGPSNLAASVGPPVANAASSVASSAANASGFGSRVPGTQALAVKLLSVLSKGGPEAVKAEAAKSEYRVVEALWTEMQDRIANAGIYKLKELGLLKQLQELLFVIVRENVMQGKPPL